MCLMRKLLHMRGNNQDYHSQLASQNIMLHMIFLDSSLKYKINKEYCLIIELPTS